MTQLILNTAVGNYGHTAPLKDGSIESEMFEMQHTEVNPVTSIFRRMVRELEFDVAEMALSTYLCARAHGKEFTGIPIFLTRAFYHGGVVVHGRSNIGSPRDLEGKKVGLRSYTLTPGVWTRGILQTAYGVDLDAVTWVLSGDEHVAEFVAPANVVSSQNSDLKSMLISGEIDAAIGAAPDPESDIHPLFPDPTTADARWHQSSGVYPISHMVVVKNSMLQTQPDLAVELCNVFSSAKTPYVERLRAGAATEPFDRSVIEMGQLVGGDPLPYGIESSLKTLETFIDFNLDQRVIPQRVDPESLFPKETLAMA